MSAERLEAFTVRPAKDDGKDFWVRIGTAWPTKQGGWSIKLDALPVTGEIVLAPPKPKDNQQQSRGGGRGGFKDDSDIPFSPEWR